MKIGALNLIAIETASEVLASIDCSTLFFSQIILEKKTPSTNLWIITFLTEILNLFNTFLNKSWVRGLGGVISFSIPIAMDWASNPPMTIGNFLFPIISLNIKA